jgi:hypothetical protein
VEVHVVVAVVECQVAAAAVEIGYYYQLRNFHRLAVAYRRQHLLLRYFFILNFVQDEEQVLKDT